MINDDPADSFSGNFHVSLQFYIDAGEFVLKEYLQTASKMLYIPAKQYKMI